MKRLVTSFRAKDLAYIYIYILCDEEMEIFVFLNFLK